MAQYLPLPDGSFVTVREGEQPADAWERAQREYPTAFGIEPAAPAPGEQPQGGFMPALKAGAQRLAGQGALAAGKAGLMDTQAAEQFNTERQQRAQQIFKPTEESFLEAPVQNVKELLGGSAPYMVAPLALAGGAAAFGAPALAGAGLAGLASGAQFFGSNLDRSMQANKTSLEDTSGANAAMAAVPQAALDVIGFRFIPGIGKLFGAAGQKVTAETAKEMAAQTAKQIAMEYAQRTGKAMTAEGLTETMQQVLERAQAGLSTVDPEARGEYLQSFFGGAIMAGTLSPAGTFVERGAAARKSQGMADEEEAKKRAAEQQAAQQREAGLIEAERNAPAAVMPDTGAAQGSLPGMENTPDVQPTPEAAEDPVQRAGFLRATIPQLDARMDEIRQSNQGGATLAERTERERLMDQLRQAKSLAEQELKALDLPDTDATARRAAKLQKQIEQADEAGDTTKALRLAEQLEALGGVQGSLDLGKTRRIDIEGNNQRAFTQLTKEELARRDEQLRAQRTGRDDSTLDMFRDSTEQADAQRDEGNFNYEIDRIKQAAGGIGEAVQQPRLFAEPQETARVGSGTAGTARSEAQVMADLDIARASQNKERVSEIVQELRALRDDNRTREADAKTKQSDASEIKSKDLEQAAGMKLPAETARRQSLTDARYRSFGQMVSTLDRFNRGRADGAALKQAEQGVIDNLVREIDSITGSPMSTMERQSVMAEARDLLADLKNRFGDTRDEVNLGTRKEPQMEPVQRRGGDFRTDLPGEGAGPTGMGLENFETQDKGSRTFGNRYAAAQSILEGLDEIRNRRAGTQETGRGTDRTDSTRGQDERLATAQAQARGTAAEPLLQQVAESKVKTPALVDNAVEAAMRAQRGQDITEQQRAITDELGRLEQGKRSETEGGKTAVQPDMFGGTGVIFDSWTEFDDWLGSDALEAIKMAQGQTRETLSRAIKMVAPLQKKAADLQAQVEKLLVRRDALRALAGEEDAKSQKDVDDATAAVMEAQDVLDFATIEYSEALTAAQEKLQAAFDEDAVIAGQIADNLKQLNQAGQMQEREFTALRKAQTQMIDLSRKVADAKQKLAKYTPTLFSSSDPISRPKLAEFNRLEKQVADLEAQLVTASTRARAAHPSGLARADADGRALATFQQQARALSQQRAQQARRIGGLTSVRNRAQARLDAALAQLEVDPEFQSLRDNKSRADQILALAKDKRRGAEAGIDAVNAEATTLDREALRVGEPVPTLRQQAIERIREARGKLPGGKLETQLDRERKDGDRRRAEQETLSARQEGPGTRRESVSFEPRRLDQESLDEAGARMAVLEDILGRVPMNEEQRTQFDEAAVEYKARSEALEKKAQARLENVEGKLAAQRKRIEMLQRAQAEYDAADVDSPQRAKAQDRVARLMDQLQKQGQKLSKAWGIRREAIVSQAERLAQADTRSQSKRNADAASVESLTEGQTKRRTSSPAMRETRQTGGFRTGNAETAEQRAGSQRQRIVESQRPKERDTPVSRAEQMVANLEAKRIKDEAAAANKEAAALKKGTPPKRRKQVDDAQTVGQVLIRALEEKPRGPKSKVQSAIDDMEFDTDGYDDALLREDNAFYADRQTHDLSEEAAEAAFDGRTLDLLDDIAANGATPTLRAVAAAVRPFLLRTRTRTKDGLTIGGRRAEGALFPQRNEVVLDSMAMSQETVMHEFVHAATIRAISGDIPLNAEQQQALGDLQALYNRIKDTPEFSKEYARKDLLEFTAEIMTNPTVREKLDKYTAGSVPLLTRLYNGFLRLLGVNVPSTSTKAMVDTMRLFAPSRSFEYRHQGVPSIMRGVFPGTKPAFNADVPQDLQALATGTVGKNPSVKDKILANVAGFRAQFVDRFDPYEDLMRKGVAKGMITDLQAAQYSYFMRFGEQRNQFVEQAATNGVPQLRKTAEGDFVIETPEGQHPNLMKIAQALTKANVGNEQATEELFTTYLAVLRGEQVGFDKLNFDRPVTAEQAAEVKAFVAADPARKEAFESARQMYREYNNGLLDFLVQTGAMDKPQATALKKGDYVPYYRQDPSGVVNLIIAGETPVRIGNIKDQPYLKELVGGNDKILPFFTGAMQNTSMLIDMALRNKQTMELSNMLQTLGVGKIRKNTGPDNGTSVNFKVNGEQVHLNIEQAVEEWGVPAELLVKGLEGIKTTIPAALRAMQIPANLLRTMITRAPAYAIRQIIREPINAWLVSGGNFTPVVSSVKELSKIVQGKSAAADGLERAGAVSSNVITGDQQDQARILRDVAQGKSAWHKVMMAADKFAMQGDTATRAVLYDKFRKQGMTHMQSTLAALESMNFARKGLSPTMQMMSMLVPFFNAQVQGLDVIYRAAKGQTTFEKKLDVQRKLIQRGAMMMAGTLAYTAMMQDDDAYKNATPQERAQNWFLPLPGLDQPLKVPIPFELGFAFKALPEVMLNTAFGDTQTKDAAKAMGALAYNSLPIGMPQAIKPAIEVMANYSFYTGDSIEGRREQTVQKGERFRDNTTELAKILGKAEVLSPVQIDYLLRGYTGGLGLTLVGLSNFALRMANPSEALADGATKTANQLPLIGALFQPTDGRGVIDEAYKDIESWQQATQTYKRMIEQGRRADAQKFAQDFSMQIALNATGGAFRQQMGELAQVRRAILANKELTPDQKRDQVDRLRQVELTLARQIRDAQRRAGG